MHHSKRVFFTVLLLASIFYAPWWVTFGLATGTAFYFKRYYELLVLGALFDILYGANDGFAMGYGMMGFIITFGLFLIIERVKKELR